MDFIRNLEYDKVLEEMTGEIYLEDEKRWIDISFEKDTDEDYIKSIVQYLNENLSTVKKLLAPSIRRFCQDELDIHPEYDDMDDEDWDDRDWDEYPEGLKEISDETAWNFVEIVKLHIDPYKEKDKNIMVLNLYGASAGWEYEDGLQWMLRDGKVIYSGDWRQLDVWQPKEQLRNGNYIYEETSDYNMYGPPDYTLYGPYAE